MKLLAAAFAAAALLVVTGCGGSLPEAASTPTAFQVSGTITVEWGDGSAPEDGGDCITDGGYATFGPPLRSP
jgi:ABC-type glycerol-3-phosphate transport system substrate-binding protein